MCSGLNMLLSSNCESSTDCSTTFVAAVLQWTHGHPCGWNTWLWRTVFWCRRRKQQKSHQKQQQKIKMMRGINQASHHSSKLTLPGPNTAPPAPAPSDPPTAPPVLFPGFAPGSITVLPPPSGPTTPVGHSTRVGVHTVTEMGSVELSQYWSETVARITVEPSDAMDGALHMTARVFARPQLHGPKFPDAQRAPCMRQVRSVNGVHGTIWS